MRRGLILLAVFAVVGFALAGAAKPGRLKAEKVAVCHLESVDSLGVEQRHYIIVNEHAVDAHIRNHGDCVVDPAEVVQAGEPCDCAGGLPVPPVAP